MNGDKINPRSWKEVALRQNLEHRFHRSEGDRNPENDISSIHGASILAEIQERLDKKPNKKVRVLDIGTGIALFPDQIRDRFGERVQVFSTGIGKKQVERHRLSHKLERLNKADLKWNSVFELSPKEEFDIIADTYGEQFYYTEQIKNGMFCGISEAWQHEKLKEYMDFVIAKLNPGGFASIAKLRINSQEAAKLFEQYCAEKKQQGIEIRLTADEVLQIRKDRS